MLISLETETSAEIMRQLPESYIQKISYEIAQTLIINPDEVDEIATEFLEMAQAREYVLDGGVEYARNLLNTALGAQRAKEVIDMLNQIQLRERPFDIARKADPQQLTNLLLHEQPQTVALILCYMQPDKAAMILSQFSIEKQAEIAERIGTITRTTPAVIEKSKSIETKFSSFVDNETESVGGVHTLVEILNSVGRSTEKNIISMLEEKNNLNWLMKSKPICLRSKILSMNVEMSKKCCVKWTMINWHLALKGVSEDIKQFIFQNLSSRAVETLQEELQFMGPARLSAVEEAQQKVVAVIRRLDEVGEIYLRRGEQDAITFITSLSRINGSRMKRLQVSTQNYP